jgi:hypothetical protein
MTGRSETNSAGRDAPAEEAPGHRATKRQPRDRTHGDDPDGRMPPDHQQDGRDQGLTPEQKVTEQAREKSEPAGPEDDPALPPDD